MGKQTKNQRFTCYAEFFGGPVDGEDLELGIVGPDPVRAFVAAVERDDIPERIQKEEHWYSVEWTSLHEVRTGEGDDEILAAFVLFVYEGLMG